MLIHITEIVNRKHSDETKLATNVHELCHLYCCQLGTPNPKWWGNRSPLKRAVEEFEDESVCWLVCERREIKNSSAKYLSGNLDHNYDIPNISIDTVLKVVASIESLIKGVCKPRKELIIRN